MPPLLRPAEKSDFLALSNFTNTLNYLHRHLDWRDTFEWLGRRPFWILEENQKILATLACPPEPETVAWIRLFAVSMHSSPDYAWQKLFERVLEDLRGMPNHPTLVSLALREWYEELLQRMGFRHHQDIVVFLFDQEPPPPQKIDHPYRLRIMQPEDLPGVTVIDHLAFEPIWQLSPDDLDFAVRKSIYCTVVERDGEIIAYQMCSSTGMYAHLARLAVHPGLQRQHIGFTVVQDLLDHFINRMNYWGVTLNTQNNNTASIALYHKLGFHETGERFPVFVYDY